jgi:hypothetical protein
LNHFTVPIVIVVLRLEKKHHRRSRASDGVKPRHRRESRSGAEERLEEQAEPMQKSTLVTWG